MKNRGEIESKGETKTESAMSIDRRDPAKPPQRICADFQPVSRHLNSSVFKPVYLDGGVGVHVKKEHVRLQSAHFRDEVLQEDVV